MTPTAAKNYETRWLSLKQATSYCPLGRKRLIRLVKDKEGKIKGGQHNKAGAWFFDRLSIDKYMESLCFENKRAFYNEKAVAFLKRVK